MGMRPISAVEMLNAWDRAATLAPTRRALEILRAACPDEPPEALAALSVGARDARLLTAREWFFGSRIESQVVCPQCEENIEAPFYVNDIRACHVEIPGTHEVIIEGCAITFRLPDSTDLELLEKLRREMSGDPEGARCLLLSRCILSGPDQLSGRVEAELVQRMSQLDPQANTRLALECPACGHHWSALFDIGTFLWQEINAWARRMLREVHTLASAYGWSEREVLSLSAFRRALYLEMVLS
jgi:hypothetical protein